MIILDSENCLKDCKSDSERTFILEYSEIKVIKKLEKKKVDKKVFREVIFVENIEKVPI